MGKMNERERLIELLEQCSCAYPPPCTSECADCNKVEMYDKEIANIADHLIANGVTVREWIPVTERLPESTRLCIASKYNVPFLAWWTGKDWRAFDTVHVVNGINYWMELPKTPEEEA